MKKPSPSLLLAAAIALCANSALAQGTMLYTWNNINHPQSLFQASFEVYDFEQTPGSVFGAGGLFGNTFIITSPDHTWLPSMDQWYQCGYCRPGNALFLNNIFSDPVFGAAVYVTADSISQRTSTGTSYWETGYWTFAPVPEPSSAALLALGLLAMANKNGIASGNGLVLILQPA